MYHHPWCDDSCANLYDGDRRIVPLRLPTGRIHPCVLISGWWIRSIQAAVTSVGQSEAASGGKRRREDEAVAYADVD